jgi:hypothetical protein
MLTIPASTNSSARACSQFSNELNQIKMIPKKGIAVRAILLLSSSA